MQKQTNEKSLRPLLRYPGGKERELKYILAALPDSIDRYYEPFLGGGAVYFAVDADCYYVNDRSDELMNFYRSVVQKDADFLNMLSTINNDWQNIVSIVEKHNNCLSVLFYKFYNDKIDDQQLEETLKSFVAKYADEFAQLVINLPFTDTKAFVKTLEIALIRKYKRMKQISLKTRLQTQNEFRDNLESLFKNAYYTHIRDIYNTYNTYKEMRSEDGMLAAFYFFIRQTCYSAMFRYNKDGDFNVSYGGISRNKTNFSKYIAYFNNPALHEKLAKTYLYNNDFYQFMRQYPPQKHDFIFIDPPYDDAFDSYSNNQFLANDQRRLADYLINECLGNFMVVIKNTDLITSLYPEGQLTARGGRIRISSFKKNYSANIKNRNKRQVKHLVITNY